MTVTCLAFSEVYDFAALKTFLDAAVAPHRYVNFGGTLVDNPPHSARYGGSLVPVRVTAHS